ncbi:hypothetical protein [Streptomyces sp. IMTB 2501]|uniref:hypothetical protein n=1 Tax=Streptomyces sp. IMTB 2501 TaxID=1776340 RepID=UPI00117E0AFE|nr:hypothetical protein [Streptomyces sp. IMTB 2501]
MFQTFKNLKTSDRAGEILKAISTVDTTCNSRVYTAASGVVAMTAHGLGSVTCVTIADNMAEPERKMLMELEARIGCCLGDAEIILREECDWPHPQMKGSTCFIQFEIFEEYV